MHYGSDVNEKEKKKKRNERCFPTQIHVLRFCFTEAITAILSMERGTQERTIKNCDAEILDTQIQAQKSRETRATRHKWIETPRESPKRRISSFHVSGTRMTIDDLLAATWTSSRYANKRRDNTRMRTRKRDLICNELITRQKIRMCRVLDVLSRLQSVKLSKLF